MKKYLILVLIVLIVGTLVIGVQAAGGKWVDAQRVPLYPTPSGSSNNVRTDLPSQGEVIFVDPMGNVTFIIQGNVEGLQPGFLYDVWIRDFDPGYTGTFIKRYAPLGYYKLDTFTTNDEGRGKFHLNIRSDDLAPGTYLIQLAINEGGGGTVVATELWVTVTIKGE